MMRWKIGVTLLLLACAMLRADTKISVAILSYVPENDDCFGRKTSLKKGIRADRLVLTIGDSSVEANIVNIASIDTDNPDYVSRITGKKIFLWGNRDSEHRLKNLNVISMHSPGKVFKITAETIRGVAKEKETLFFFTSRTPPVLRACNLENGSYRPAEIREYLHCVENVGVKILDSGKVMFLGTGLKSCSTEFEIPRPFLREHGIDTECTWNLLLNSDEYAVMYSMEKIRHFIALDRANGHWMFFQADESCKDVARYANYLVLQKHVVSENKTAASIFNLDTGELRSFRLMPFSRIIYYSPDFSLIAQPYRLLLLENRKDEPGVRKVIDYNPAWYINLLLVEHGFAGNME